MDAGDRICWKIASSSDSVVGITSIVVIIAGGKGCQNEWLGDGGREERREEVGASLTCSVLGYRTYIHIGQ